jgi:hypothetical protein
MSAYSSAVLADNPVHYWRMADPGGGIAHDVGSSPLHLHGLGSAISQPLGYSGPISDGGSMDLCLDGQYANTGNPITITVNPFTVEMWYWNWQALAATRLLIQIQSANQIALFHDATLWRWLYNGVQSTSNFHFTSQIWHHLVGTYDGANAKLYVDSTPAAPAAVAPQAAVSTIMELSANAALGVVWGGGFFAEVAIYATALSQTRVSAHYVAADQQGQAPINLASGGGGGAPFTSALGTILSSTSDILAAVRKAF